MYTKKIYRAVDLALWTRFDTLRFLAIGFVTVALYELLGLNGLKIPWTPLALIGTAVAFLIGFQNNAAYGRIWEARKIWGGIVNTSRTFGMYAQDMVSNEHATQALTDDELASEVQVLTHRHIAWMTALRHAMRAQRPWEDEHQRKTNREWDLRPPEREVDLDTELGPYLGDDDIKYIANKSNKQTALLYLQSHHLRRLKEAGHIWEFSFIELEQALQELFTLQGKSERIKNFPYPRQFATLTHYFIWLFVLLLPLALIPQFAEIGAEIGKTHARVGESFVWSTIPFYVAVAWVFHTMERIGRTGENPFEGTSNDVPISTIARGIEIDLRQNLGDPPEKIPEPLPSARHIQILEARARGSIPLARQRSLHCRRT